jgi:hypothetical protein
MKKNYLLFILLIVAQNFSFGQCPFNNAFYRDLTPAGPGLTASDACVFGGDLVTTNVIFGETYVFSTCNNVPLLWDSQLTLYNAAGTVALAYDDDFCATYSQITWVATYTGIANLVIDEYNCMSNSTCMNLDVTRLNPCASFSASTTTTNVSCFGGNEGAIDLTTSGGTAPFTYAWSNGATTEDLIGLTEGVYTCTVTTASSCTVTTSATITEPASALSLSTTQTNVSCFGGNNGAINLTATGGTGPYTYQWSNGSISEDIINRVSGVYTCTVTTASSCTVTTSATITEPASALSLSTTQTNVSCFGGNNGAINLTATGGTGPYTYQWSNGSISEDIINRVSGVYTCTVTTASSCTATASATITQPASALSLSTTTTNISCFGGNNGSINLTASGGTGPYTYQWSNGATTEDLINLGGGTYTGTVTTASSCTATTSATITQPASALSLSTTTTNISCFGGNNGSINLTAFGGTGPYSYQWSNGATTEDLINLGGGVYTCTVTTASSCTATTSAIISEPTAITATASVVNNVSCNGLLDGSASANVTGGTGAYSYAWSNGATTATITNLGPGVYTYTVTDANNCSATATTTISEPTVLLATASVVNNVTCNGLTNGSATANVTGGTGAYSYAWSNGATTATITNLGPGVYTYTVTDANNCSASASTTISEPTVLLATSSVVNNVSCNGLANGSATANVTGGTGTYSYAWSNGATTATITNLGPGVYTYTVADANNCSASASTTISEPTVLLATASVANNVSCNGLANGSATANVTDGTGAYSYAWSNGATTATITNLGPGVYTYTVTDANNCSATATTTISEPTVLLATASVDNNVSCNGLANGSASANVTGGTGAYSYAWSNGATTATITNLGPGVYTYTVTDANNCSASVSTTISEPTVLLATASVVNNVSCNGLANGSASANVTGGTGAYSYAWSNGATTTTITNLEPFAFTYTVTDANNCSATATTTISEPTVLLATASVVNNVSCNGLSDGSASANVTGGTGAYSYAWSNGATTATITNLGPGVYTYTVTDANNCSASVSTTISEPTVLLATASVVNNVSCNGLANGSASANVTGGTGAYSYAWSNGATTTTITNLEPFAFTYTVTDANNCSATATTTISEPTVLLATASVVNNVSCNGLSDGSASANVTGGTGAYSYAWSNGATTATITNLEPFAFTYTVTDVNNCTAASSVTITEPTSIDATTSLSAETITATEASASYQWVDCDNANAPIANETNQSFTATANGNYAVVVTVGACNEMSACVNIASVGLRDITSINYTVQPNPTTGLFTVTANTSEAMTVKVYDMIGKLIVSQSTVNNSSNIDLSNYENGVYSLTIETANKKSTSRIVLTK